MAKMSPGNGPGGPGNVTWGPGNIPGISINANLSLRATKNARDKVVEVICLLHQIWFPGISWNFSPFLHTFPGDFFFGRKAFSRAIFIKDSGTFDLLSYDKYGVWYTEESFFFYKDWWILISQRKHFSLQAPYQPELMNFPVLKSSKYANLTSDVFT